MNPVLTLSKNTKGRDILCTDVHGQYHLLKQALVAINFNPEVDRLIIAGDLIDRGKNSKLALNWASKDYCFATIGNHDAQHIFHRELNKFSKNLACMPPDPWFVELEGNQYEQYFDEFKKHIYPALEIETSKGMIGVIHGELPLGETWKSAKERLNNLDYDFLYECIWNRDLAKIAQRESLTKVEQKAYIVPDLKWMIHGHSPSSKFDYHPYSLANRLYIDTAAYKASKPEKYPTAGITLFDAENPIKPLYTTAKRELIYATQIKKENSNELSY